MSFKRVIQKCDYVVDDKVKFFISKKDESPELLLDFQRHLWCRQDFKLPFGRIS